jgi:hypothetical protein
MDQRRTAWKRETEREKNEKEIENKRSFNIPVHTRVREIEGKKGCSAQKAIAVKCSLQ